MDVVWPGEQRQRLQTIENELEDVKRKMACIWHAIGTSDIRLADASDRIREHRDRQERLEDAALDARATLSQRRAVLDDVDTIAAYAQEMSEFLRESKMTERRAFIETLRQGDRRHARQCLHALRHPHARR